MEKKTTGPIKQDWVGKPQDAINLAALRWYVCTIDRLCIEIYATNRRKYPKLAKLLKKQLNELKALGTSAKVEDDDECPPGFVKCDDGLCAPACDVEFTGD